MTSPAEPTDAQLVERRHAGEGDALTALVERVSRYVHAIIVEGFRLRTGGRTYGRTRVAAILSEAATRAAAHLVGVNLALVRPRAARRA